MNDLTKRLLAEAAKKYKTLAERNDADFHFHVYNAYCDHIIDVLGSGLMLRACRLLKLFSPQYFDPDGYLLDYVPCVYNVELKLSAMVMRMAWKIVERTPELKLDEWDEVPGMNQQLTLF